MGSHPVAVVQYTFTHKQYTRHKTNHTTTQKLGIVRAMPRLCGFYHGICVTTEEKAQKNLREGCLGKRKGHISFQKVKKIFRYTSSLKNI